LIFLAQLPLGASAASCAGGDPAITSVKVGNVSSNGGLTSYTIDGVVANLGSARQASNVLQFVDIYQGKTRLDVRGIPPLAPGQNYAWSYVWHRASDAGSGTTTLRLSLRMVQPPGVGSEDCNASNDFNSVTF
jgi:hypothetical protein